MNIKSYLEKIGISGATVLILLSEVTKNTSVSGKLETIDDNERLEIKRRC
jgi:hypothetical protein